MKNLTGEQYTLNRIFYLDSDFSRTRYAFRPH
jgi:hypothetical protein